MNSKTRRLQLLMRALRKSDLQDSLVRNVAAEMARVDAKRPVRTWSSLQRAVTQPEMAED